MGIGPRRPVLVLYYGGLSDNKCRQGQEQQQRTNLFPPSEHVIADEQQRQEREVHLEAAQAGQQAERSRGLQLAADSPR